MKLEDCANPEHFLIGQITATLRHPDEDAVRQTAIFVRDYYADQARRRDAEPVNADLAEYARQDAEAMNQTINRLTKGAQ